MGEFQKLAKLSDLEEGKVFVAETRYNRVGLTKLGADICAFADLCTHDGEDISTGELEGEIIICPRHSAKFNIRTGKVLCMPAVEDLPVYKTRIVGDDVEVELED